MLYYQKKNSKYFLIFVRFTDLLKIIITILDSGSSVVENEVRMYTKNISFSNICNYGNFAW